MVKNELLFYEFCSLLCHIDIQSLMAILDYLEFKGYSLTQMSFSVGTCNIFLMVPVWWPRLMTYRVMHSLILMLLLAGLNWFLSLSIEISFISLRSSFIFFYISLYLKNGIRGFLFSVVFFFLFYYSFFYYVMNHLQILWAIKIKWPSLMSCAIQFCLYCSLVPDYSYFFVNIILLLMTLLMKSLW